VGALPRHRARRGLPRRLPPRPALGGAGADTAGREPPRRGSLHPLPALVVPVADPLAPAPPECLHLRTRRLVRFPFRPRPRGLGPAPAAALEDPRKVAWTLAPRRGRLGAALPPRDRVEPPRPPRGRPLCLLAEPRRGRRSGAGRAAARPAPTAAGAGAPRRRRDPRPGCR